MLVSIIAVVFNEANVLPLVHHALSELRRPEGVEIETIAVDGGSRDHSVSVARACGFDQVIELPGASIPACRNAGLRAARGDWIAFVDADCVLDPDWLQHANRLMIRHERLILGWPAAPPVPGTWVQRAWHAHWMNKNPAVEIEEGETVVKQGGFRMVTTRNMIMHRAVSDHIGGFDETLSTGEDTDFVFRAAMAGTPAWGLPALKSVHLGEPDTLRRFYRQQVWHANRRAYKTILAKSGMKAGANAPLFTILFLICGLISICAATAGFWQPVLWWGIGLLPLLLLLLAGRTAIRAKQPSLTLPLGILYGAYGVARVFDLLGLSPHKPSWKKR